MLRKQSLFNEVNLMFVWFFFNFTQLNYLDLSIQAFAVTVGFDYMTDICYSLFALNSHY